ncbi:MAG: hypothetical protein HQK96_04170 [Nitrospirae bacterium]|nr:hypothetical protein [Nitrospirota bacterium]MBF0553734.1 hypothetical protein [Nitrospirota bacterium]
MNTNQNIDKPGNFITRNLADVSEDELRKDMENFESQHNGLLDSNKYEQLTDPQKIEKPDNFITQNLADVSEEELQKDIEDFESRHNDSHLDSYMEKLLQEMETYGMSKMSEEEQKILKRVKDSERYLSQGLVASQYAGIKVFLRHGDEPDDYTGPNNVLKYCDSTNIKEINRFLLSDGIVDWYVPSGVIVLYVDDLHSRGKIESMCSRLSISPGCYEFEGMYYFFKYKTCFPSGTKYTANGLEVTYLTSEDYYPQLTCLYEGEWKTWVNIKDLPTLPVELEPEKQ